MRALTAAAGGLVLAVLFVLAVTALGAPGGETSPRPLLTTAPPAPGQ
ncbi:SPW_0924 family protein [Streptomyces sp. CB00455]|nr:SPW_0924 family protein [Streptomyces sp. CB00455]